MKLTTEQLDEIEQAAKKVAPGPWRLEGDEVVLDRPATDADMAYIATMDPATTLALVAEVRELRAAITKIREAIDSPDEDGVVLSAIVDALADLEAQP